MLASLRSMFGRNTPVQTQARTVQGSQWPASDAKLA